jgi:hypothetical protein
VNCYICDRSPEFTGPTAPYPVGSGTMPICQRCFRSWISAPRREVPPPRITAPLVAHGLPPSCPAITVDSTKWCGPKAFKRGFVVPVCRQHGCTDEICRC